MRHKPKRMRNGPKKDEYYTVRRINERVGCMVLKVGVVVVVARFGSGIITLQFVARLLVMRVFQYEFVIHFALPGASGWLSSRRFRQSAKLSLSPMLARSSFFTTAAGCASKSNVLLSR